MRTFTALACALLVVPMAATALVPGDHRVAWYNGDLDSAVDAPTFNEGFGLHNAEIGDLDGDGENELIINGHANGNARFSKNQMPGSGAVATRQPVPSTARLEFDLESRAGGSCFVYHDIRVILLGALDPMPALDTLYDLSPIAPVDYFNDEVLVFSAQFTGQTLQKGHVALDPLQAKMLGGGFAGFGHPFNSMSEGEKEFFLAQHVHAVWVVYGAAYEGGQSHDGTECAFDNFAYVL